MAGHVTWRDEAKRPPLKLELVLSGELYCGGGRGRLANNADDRSSTSHFHSSGRESALIFFGRGKLSRLTPAATDKLDAAAVSVLEAFFDEGDGELGDVYANPPLAAETTTETLLTKAKGENIG
ncbi:MAG TPA: hypothetical protein VFY06_15810 [Verrucomicrobiae bacterium]|nr:hypothetical protein [Verrucomicrobiae bacterium]